MKVSKAVENPNSNLSFGSIMVRKNEAEYFYREFIDTKNDFILERIGNKPTLIANFISEAKYIPEDIKQKFNDKLKKANGFIFISKQEENELKEEQSAIFKSFDNYKKNKLGDPAEYWANLTKNSNICQMIESLINNAKEISLDDIRGIIYNQKECLSEISKNFSKIMQERENFLSGKF